MKPKVDSITLDYTAMEATAVIRTPHTAYRIFEHIELFVEQWAGLQPDTLHLIYDADGAPSIYLRGVECKQTVRYYEVAFTLTVPPTRKAIEEVNWERV